MPSLNRHDVEYRLLGGGMEALPSDLLPVPVDNTPRLDHIVADLDGVFTVVSHHGHFLIFGSDELGWQRKPC